MEKKFHSTICRTCGYLSMLGLKLIRVSNRGSRHQRDNLGNENPLGSYHVSILKMSREVNASQTTGTFSACSIAWSGWYWWKQGGPYYRKSSGSLHPFCGQNPSVTEGFTPRMTSNAESFSMSRCHHVSVHPVWPHIYCHMIVNCSHVRCH